MKKAITILFICIAGLSFAEAQKTKSKMTVKYTIAKNYFSSSKLNELEVKKITSKEALEKDFGYATLMGPNGKPTEIDFSKSYVVAIVSPTNNTTEKISIDEITKENGQINISYRIIGHESPSSASFKHFVLIIIDKNDDGFVVTNRFGPNNEPMMGGDLDENGCKPSAGYTWSVIENACVSPFTSQYIIEGEKVNAMGNVALIISPNGEKAEIIGSVHGKNIILTKSKEKATWVGDKLKLESVEKDKFILKENDQEIGKGRLRN